MDEVNFWQPSGLRRFRAVPQDRPFIFRLKTPHNAIGGFGYFARNVPRVPAWYAWEAFGVKNGLLPGNASLPTRLPEPSPR